MNSNAKKGAFMILLKKLFPILLVLYSISSTTSSFAADCSTECPAPCASCTCININCCPLLQQSCTVFGKNFFAGRSQGFNTPRLLMEPDYTTTFIEQPGFSIYASVAGEYQKIFRNSTSNCNNNSIGTWFSLNGSNNMTYGLDNVTPGTGAFNINALNFGLTASGSFQFFPKKSDFIVDINLFFDFSPCLRGLWSRLAIPIVHSSWKLQLNETSTGQSSTYYPTDSVGAGNIPVAFTTMKQSFKSMVGFGDAPVLTKGKLCGERVKNGVADIRFDLGYDIITRPCWFTAGSFVIFFPVGNRPCANFIFNTEIGGLKQWQFGGHLLTQYKLWERFDGLERVTCLLDLTATGMLASQQNRLLGLLINNEQSPWSQYLLLKKFNAAGQAVGLERAANILASGNIVVGAPYQIDLSIMVDYKNKGFFTGVGYDLWLRGSEKLKGRCFDIPADTYGIKGGTQWNGLSSDPTNNETASLSTIRLNAPADTTTTYLSNDDLDYCAALHPAAHSNGAFGFVGYQWHQHCNQPYVLVGGQVELGSSNRAFSQWGIIGKVGMTL